MLRFVGSQRSVLTFLGVTTLIALGALLGPGTDWVLDLLTAIIAAATAFMACARLALGIPNAAARRAWQIALALFGLVCLSQLAAAFGQTLAAIERVGSGLLLAAALVLVWLIARIDPLPAAARRVFWSAFVVQAAGMAAPPLGWVGAADFLSLDRKSVV